MQTGRNVHTRFNRVYDLLDPVFGQDSTGIGNADDHGPGAAGNGFGDADVFDATVGAAARKAQLARDQDEEYVVGIFRDIAERKRAEKLLRESEQRFRLAGKAAYDLIYEWDVASDSLEWYGDVDGILGFEAGEISRDIEAWLGLIHPEDVGILSDAVELHLGEAAQWPLGPTLLAERAVRRRRDGPVLVRRAPDRPAARIDVLRRAHLLG